MKIFNAFTKLLLLTIGTSIHFISFSQGSTSKTFTLFNVIQPYSKKEPGYGIGVYDLDTKKTNYYAFDEFERNCPYDSRIEVQSGKTLNGKISVKVFAERGWTEEDLGYTEFTSLLFRFDSENQDAYKPVNAPGYWVKGYESWTMPSSECIDNNSGKKLADCLVELVTTQMKNGEHLSEQNSVADKFPELVPVRIEITFEDEADVDNFESIQIPRMPVKIRKQNFSSTSVKFMGMKVVHLGNQCMRFYATKLKYEHHVRDMSGALFARRMGIVSLKDPSTIVDFRYRQLMIGDLLLPMSTLKDGYDFFVPPLYKIPVKENQDYWLIADGPDAINNRLEIVGGTFEIAPEVVVDRFFTAQKKNLDYKEPPGNRISYKLFKVRLKLKPGSDRMYIIGKPNGLGPFPVAYQFDPGPVSNEASEPFINGPSEEKPNIIGSHRGYSRLPGLPENSPWAWERAIFESDYESDGLTRRANPYLDCIEVDFRAVSKDKKILAAHDTYPYRALNVGPSGKNIITVKGDGKGVLGFKQYMYETETIEKSAELKSAEFIDANTGKEETVGNLHFPALKDAQLRDIFGKLVEGKAHLLTIDNVFAYFKCRQENDACTCLSKIGYIPERSATHKTWQEVFDNTSWLKDKTWVIKNDRGKKIMIALDKIVNKGLEWQGIHGVKDRSYLIETFGKALEQDMEDYLVYGGRLPTKMIDDRGQRRVVKDKVEEENYNYGLIMHQILYMPIFYWDDKIERRVSNDQYVRKAQLLEFIDFMRRSYRKLSPHNRWHTIGCQAQINLPLESLQKYIEGIPEHGTAGSIAKRRKLQSLYSGQMALKYIIEIAQKRNKWVEIYGGTPLAAFGMSNHAFNGNGKLGSVRNPTSDWRSVPEFSLAYGNNYWVGDAPNFTYNFLSKAPNAQKSGELRSTDDLFKEVKIHDGSRSKEPVFLSNHINSRHLKYLFADKMGAYVSGAQPLFRSLTFGGSFVSGDKDLEISLESKDGIVPQFEEVVLKGKKLSQKVLNMENTYLKMPNFFGMKDARNFTLITWVYYEKSKASFKLFNVYKSASLTDKPLFGLNCVDGNLVLTRNIGKLYADGNENFQAYTYQLDQGMRFDEDNQWYCIIISVTDHLTQVMMGKPYEMDYLSANYNMNWGGGVQPDPMCRVKDAIISEYWMGSTMQHFDQAGMSYIGDPDFANGPSKLATLRVYDQGMAPEAMYRYFGLNLVKENLDQITPVK